MFLPKSLGMTRLGFCNEMASYHSRRYTALGAYARPYDDFFRMLLSDGTFGKLDTLSVYADPNSRADALLNLIEARYTSTLSATLPTWAAARGFTGSVSGTAPYVDSNFNSSTAAGRYTQNLASVFAWTLTDGGYLWGDNVAAYGNLRTSLIPHVGTDLQWGINVTTPGHSDANSTYTGLFTLTRSASNREDVYVNAAAFANRTVASVALSNTTRLFGTGYTGSGNGSASQMAIVGQGGLLLAANVVTLHRACRDLLKVLGAI